MTVPLHPTPTGTAQFVRVVCGGQAAWQHDCGRIELIDLLADDDDRSRWHCPNATDEGQGRPETWRPVFAYVGDRCDQCSGHGWVPISGKVYGAPCGYITVTECTACQATGLPAAAGRDVLNQHTAAKE